jgi:SAM-dependent methyltransferase
MTLPAPDPEILAFYTSGYDEAARLRRSAEGRLEFARTRDLLERHLPPAPAAVLDVGGGPGAHAAWLAEAGYEVTLVDPVPRHREQAAAHGGYRVYDGDARALGYADGAFDAVLLLGPLYHLTAREDRVRAVSEARRVVRADGGLVAAAVISRHAPLVDFAATGRLDDLTEPGLLRSLRTGLNDPAAGFTTAYFHTADEVRAEFAEAGFADQVTVFAVEGPLWALMASGLAEDRADLFAAARRIARLTEADPALLANSGHLLAIARR